MRKKIAIIGGGPAAISTCLQLVYTLRDKLPHHVIKQVEVTVFEKSNAIGKGLPYSHEIDEYILNLPVKAMGTAFKELLDFDQWMQAHAKPEHRKTNFPPRYYFGQYLNKVAEKIKSNAKKNNIKLTFKTGVAIDKLITNLDGGYTLSCSTSSKKYETDYIVLATGHMPSDNYRELIGYPGYIHDPWDSRAYGTNTESIGIAGTGLTAIDTILRLFKNHEGLSRVTAVSHKGLPPTVLADEIKPHILQHITIQNITEATKSGSTNLSLEILEDWFWREMSIAQGKPINLDAIVKNYRQQSPTEWLKDEIATAEKNEKPWQDALFSMYPIAPFLWKLLSAEDKMLFLDKYNSLFLTYVAAFPLDSAKKIYKLLENGKLEIVGGLERITPIGDGFVIETLDQYQYYVKKLFNATGTGYNPYNLPLYRNMINDGLAQKDPFGGIRVDPQTSQVLNREGIAQPCISAVGELTKGTFYATTDMNQVYQQTRLIAEQISNEIYPLTVQPTKGTANQNSSRVYHSQSALNGVGFFGNTNTRIKCREVVKIKKKFSSKATTTPFWLQQRIVKKTIQNALNTLRYCTR